MKRFLIAAMIFAAPLCSIAQDGKDVPESARWEILRRGDMVQECNPDIRDEEGEAVAMALAPPADDSHKWFISLITQKNCKPCEQLRADFAGTDCLKAWVNVEDYKQSWAHYQVFQSEDKTQEFRWKGVKDRIKGYPVVIIQPPVNGSFGDPKTVVFLRCGYNSKPTELARDMSEAIKAYSRKMAPENAAFRAKRLSTLEEKEAAGHSQRPPVQPVSPLGPPGVDPSPEIPPGPNTPVNPASDVGALFSILFSILAVFIPSAPTFFLFVLSVLKVFEMFTKRTKTTLDDQVVAAITAAVKAALQQQPTPTPVPTPPPTPTT